MESKREIVTYPSESQNATAWRLKLDKTEASTIVYQLLSSIFSNS